MNNKMLYVMNTIQSLCHFEPTTSETDPKGLAFTIHITLPVLVKSLMFYGEVLAEIMGVLLYVTFH